VTVTSLFKSVIKASEDDVSDLVNDRPYLEAIKKDFEKYRDELVEAPDNAKADA
jgi:hypothetical protein